MHRVSEQMIYLGQILALAPSLRSIYLESLDHSGNLANQPTEPGTGPLMETAECRSSVTSLVIKRFCIKQPELEAILERHCRNLETFHIISAARISYRDLTDWTLPLVDIFDRREFLQTVRVLCPKINSLHFSFFHPDPERDSMVPLMQTFPRLKELSMPDADLSQYSVQLHQYLRQLTRLEIVPKVVAMDSLVKTLHNLLCDAPNLEHLIASKFPFRAEFFDVQSSSSTSSSPLTVAAERPWACRRLKTLHLGFDGSTTSRFYTRAGTSRLVFGYLGKVVPRLEDLALSGIPLYMGREGGLCLLSRLKNLERLDLQSAVKVSFDEDSFEWMDTGSSGSEARGLEWGPRRESKPEMWKLLVEELVANTNSARINGLKSRVIDLQHAGQVEHDALIENDFCRVGSMVDVEECLQEIAQVSVCRKLMAQVPDGAREHNSNLDHYLELLKSLGLKPVLPRFHFCRIYFPLTVPSAAGSSSQETELTKIFSRYRPAVQLDIHHWNPKARVDV
ncbi:hypothetical protein BG004_007026 [Podila humilis]|nr:hypothetical protein BG004_007026 [Podila humilis]